MPRVDALLVLLLLGTLPAPGQAAPPTPPAVAQGKDGRLVYAADDDGNRIIDFSSCGYMGGDTAIPNVPIGILVAPADGDDTARIQAALDEAARLAVKPAAAVLLQPGRYEVAGQLRFTGDNGVVLRGSGMGDDGTTIIATGHDRRTLIVVGRPVMPHVESPTPVTDAHVPVHAARVRVQSAGQFAEGDSVIVRRPCTAEWVKALGMDYMGGERHGFTWRPGSRELTWDRRVTRVNGDEITFDAPITTALDARFGVATVARCNWAGRVTHFGIENLRLQSDYDPQNAKDENHSWIAVTLDGVTDSWVRQVTFAHFAGGAVHVGASCRRVTVEDCRSLAPVSEIGGHRRHTFFTAGQQTLVQRCYSEQGIRDFAVGFCSPGPNAFVQCEAKDALGDSGPIDSWASGVLYDNVKIDGNAIVLADRRYASAGAGWSAANSVLWQCQAAVIRCDAPPTANNWAVGSWGTFDGNGVWQQSNETVRPRSLYYAQLAERVGKAAMERAHLVPEVGDASTSPTVAEAAALTAAAAEPPPQLAAWIAGAAERDPIPSAAQGAMAAAEVPSAAPSTTKSTERLITIKGGVIVCGDQPVTGGRQNVQWWRGSLRPDEAAKSEVALTRFVPGRDGRGLTDDLDELTEAMVKAGKVALDHNYGLWYDRRRDDHQRVRRMDGDVWPPFFEQPFARSGQGVAWDGLSKYDLTRYNPWYWDRLRAFVRLGQEKGLVLFHHHYFQHNILEAGAHWADSPWRTANNVNDTGFPEPPPYAGDKRIFLAEQFYDVTNANRRALHRAFIRQCLSNFDGQHNVVHLTSAEYTGPLRFTQFWIDTIAEWQRETGTDPLVAISATKDVQDAILEDAARANVVDVIDIRYWWFQADGSLYAPQGGANLAPRQHARQLKPRGSSAEQVERAVREYRTKYPQKAVVYSADGFDRFGPAAAAAGGSLAQVRR